MEEMMASSSAIERALAKPVAWASHCAARGQGWGLGALGSRGVKGGEGQGGEGGSGRDPREGRECYGGGEHAPICVDDLDAVVGLGVVRGCHDNADSLEQCPGVSER